MFLWTRQAFARITPTAFPYFSYKCLSEHTRYIVHRSTLSLGTPSTMSTPKASTVSHKKGSTKRVLIPPSEKANSYFPKGASALTPASTTSAIVTTETPFGSNTSASQHPLSPLDREYTIPFLYDIDVARQLSKQPTFWSVRGWVQRSAGLNVQPAAEDPKARTKKFEEAKRDLLASVSRF